MRKRPTPAAVNLPLPRGLIIYTLSILAIAATLALLYVGRPILVPFIIAVLIWYLINAFAAGLRRLSIRQWRMGNRLSFTMAILLVLATLWLLTEIIVSSVQPMVANAPMVASALKQLINEQMLAFGIQEPHALNHLLSNIRIDEVLTTMVNEFSDMAGKGTTVLIYLIFLFIEQNSFSWKLSVLLKNPSKEAIVKETLLRIADNIRTYVTLKTLSCLIIALMTLTIMLMTGLNDAGFWAMLIFFLSYIPYIGPSVGVLLPSLAAVAQFDSATAVFTTIIGLTSSSFVIGNLVEPRMFGHSLNLSPLVLLMALAIWGYLWGLAGLLLCIPIMVTVLIILDYFPSTRPIAMAMAIQEESPWPTRHG